MKKRSFFRSFIIAFILFCVLFTPAMMLIDRVSNATIFIGEDEEAEEMPEAFLDTNSPFFEAFNDKARINLMLLGVNSGLTDTIMVISYDTKANHVDLISVPRDTYYVRPGYNGPAEKKINAIYYPQGVSGTAAAVSDVLLGMPIHYYIVMDYDGVKAIVDSMGGVPIDVPRDMKYRDPYDKPPLVIDLKAGYQVLDGEKAVQYLRYRKGYADGDIGRISAQQEFMKAAFKQMLGFKLPAVAKTVIENVDSNITIGAATKIASKATGLSSEDITTYTLPNDPKMVGGVSYVFVDSEETAAMLTEIYSLEPDPELDENGNPIVEGGIEEEPKTGFFAWVKGLFSKDKKDETDQQ